MFINLINGCIFLKKQLLNLAFIIYALLNNHYLLKSVLTTSQFL